MVKYVGNSQKNKMLKFELPSTPGAEVHVPDHLGYGNRIKVRSAGYRVQVESTGEGHEIWDPAASEHELVHLSLLHEKAWTNLTSDDDDGNEQPIKITPYWIDYVMDEKDAAVLGQFLMSQFQDDINPNADTSAEGNVGEKSESNETTSENSDSSLGQEDTTSS